MLGLYDVVSDSRRYDWTCTYL